MIHFEKVKGSSVMAKIEGSEETLLLEMTSMLYAFKNNDRLDDLFTRALKRGVESDDEPLQIDLKGDKEAIKALLDNLLGDDTEERNFKA